MKFYICALMVFIAFVGCKDLKTPKKTYKNHIGDTEFNPEIDNPNFKFCDSSKVLHKRALIYYTGGTRALEEALLNAYTFKPKYAYFTGYIIIRFAINCNNKIGRIRTEVLDSDFNATTDQNDIEAHFASIFKHLEHWNHAIYKGESYDGYSFYTVKIVNGKILKS